MKLNDEQIRQLYEGLIKPFQHPDPIGYLARALLLSEGDSDFAEDGFVGFVPVRPGDALQQVGAQEVQSLQSNVTATLAMDRLNFDTYQNLDDMVLAMHFPDDVIDSENRTKDQRELLEAIDEAREDIAEIIDPPLATVDDIIRILQDNRDNVKVSKKRMDFFCYLLDRKA